MTPDDEQNSNRWAAFVPPGQGKQWPWKTPTTLSFGAVVLLLLAGATSWWGIAHFEQRLDKHARADLASAGVNLDELVFDWDYRNVALAGELPADVSEEKIIEVLRSTDGQGIRDINLQLTRAPEQPPAVIEKGTIDLTATLAEGLLTLRGTVLTEAQRERIYTAANTALGAENVIRQIGVSGLQEAIPGADRRVESFANSIAGLDADTEADAVLSATDFRFNAAVDDENKVVDLLQRRGSAGDVGLVISGDIIAKKSVPGAVFDVRARKSEDRITLSGVVISDQQRQRLFDAATRAVAGGAVVDELTVVAGDDDNQRTGERMALIIAALDTFAVAEEADAHITGNLFEFDSMVEFEEQSTPMLAVRQAAADSGMEVSGAIESRKISLSREVALLQQEIDLLAQEIRENVVFDSSRKDLGFTAKQTLDKVVDAMNRYQRPVVLISGHTDSSGSSIDNELLSLERASTVRQYLEDSGIYQLRLRAVGFGEAAPIASNDTEVGRKQNRRVEFTARSSFDN
ncbi:MAG: OmpA family protein [Pseudomonadota bacterium]